MFYNDVSYDASFLSSDPLAVGPGWNSEPHFSAVIIQRSPFSDEETLIDVKGTLRARARSDGRGSFVGGCYRCSRDGQPFDGLCCPACRAIKQENDFHHRVVRRAGREESILSGDRDAEDLRSRRDDMLTHPELLDVARSRRSEVARLQSREWLLVTKLAAFRARVLSLKEKVAGAALRGDLRKLTDDLTKAWDDGKFESRRHLFDFIADLTHSVVLTDDDAGKRSKNMRWHESSHRIFQVMTKLGGPRTQRFIAANLESPDRRTIERRWSASKHVRLFNIENQEHNNRCGHSPSSSRISASSLAFIVNLTSDSRSRLRFQPKLRRTRQGSSPTSYGTRGAFFFSSPLTLIETLLLL